MVLWCFRAGFCSPPAPTCPVLCLPQPGGTAMLWLQQWHLLVPASTGLGDMHPPRRRNHSCWGLSWEPRGEKPISPHQLFSSPCPSSSNARASCCKGASCWWGLFCGAGLGRDDGLSQAASAKINFSCLAGRVSGSAGVYLRGSGCLHFYGRVWHVKGLVARHRVYPRPFKLQAILSRSRARANVASGL